MSAISVAGDTSGSITLQAPAVAGSTVLTLPATTATLITDSAGILNIGSGQVYKDASGNVGIGTTSPTLKLQVTSVNNFVGIINSTSAANSSFLTFTDPSTTLSSGFGPIIGSMGNNLIFGRGGVSEYMRIDSSGNVGIGTSSPVSKLDIGTGNLNFSGTAQRITGDFSNTTQANKVGFQTSTTNGPTVVAAIPNGSSTITQWRAYNSSDPDNSAYITMVANGLSQAQLVSGIIGTGTYLPMTFLTGGSERLRIDTSGNMGIGTTSPNASAILDAQSTTKGVRFPNMTTTQKTAISSPAAGLVVFDTTLAKLCVYSGAAWQTITSI